MGGFDWIIATILIVSMLVGFIRGFIEEALSLIAWIVAIWLALTYYVEAGEMIHQYVNIPAPLFRGWAGFAMIFISSLIVFGLLTWLIMKIFVPGRANIGDRILGIGFGAVRGTAIVVALLVVAKGFGMESSDWWQNSKHLAKFEPLTKVVEQIFPNAGLTPEEPEPENDPMTIKPIKSI